MMNIPKFYLINNSHVSQNDMSGGERIAMELARNWRDKFDINLCTSNFGIAIWEKYNLSKEIRIIQFSNLKEKTNIFLSYLARTLVGIFKFLSIEGTTIDKTIVYSASDFWPDSLVAFAAKIKNPKVIWIAGFYMFAPMPWQKDSPYKGWAWFRGFFYWLSQMPVYGTIKNLADFVFVTSLPDVNRFMTKKRNQEKIVVIKGGVDIAPSQDYLDSKDFIAPEKREYDACFVGRFHYQKGIFELIDIWKKVCEKKPSAKLAMVGVGPLEEEAKSRIARYHLQKNISLMGFMDGEEKYRIFKNSKLVVHPATYDSGGMAAAEAMAWGLPGISFDLEALKTYYPKGMLKTKCFDLDEFANNIARLLKDGVLYGRLSVDAVAWVREEWDWNKRATSIYENILRGEVFNKNEDFGLR
jgi:glycosyltransferase involved in cell wall biosynthesis